MLQRRTHSGFSMIELLVVVAVILAVVIGLDPRELKTWLIVIPLMLALLVSLRYVAARFLEGTVGRPFTQKKNRLSSRRRMTKGSVMRTEDEVRFDAMSDAELDAWIEREPENPTAVEIRCERLLKAKRMAEYVREMEYFMTLKHGLSPEEASTRYQRLADIYANQLNRPDKAEEMIKTIIADYPKSRQAVHARQWLARRQGG